MRASTLPPAAGLGSLLLVVLALCGMMGVSSATSIDRNTRADGLFIPFFNFFRRSSLLTRRIDSGANATFYLSRNEWQLFEVYQEPQISCSCTVTCLDPGSSIDFYMTFNPRIRFNNNWDGWACEQTLASNTQTCYEVPPVAGDICWVAVRGDKINRPHQACRILCDIDGKPPA